jgi:hypothetical protein
MDSIDITDSVFSLDVPDLNQVIGNTIDGNDYTMYIYIGAAVLIIIICMFIYRYYKNKENKESEEDCTTGFCTMKQNNREI